METHSWRTGRRKFLHTQYLPAWCCWLKQVSLEALLYIASVSMHVMLHIYHLLDGGGFWESLGREACWECGVENYTHVFSCSTRLQAFHHLTRVPLCPGPMNTHPIREGHSLWIKGLGLESTLLGFQSCLPPTIYPRERGREVPLPQKTSFTHLKFFWFRSWRGASSIRSTCCSPRIA